MAVSSTSTSAGPSTPDSPSIRCAAGPGHPSSMRRISSTSSRPGAPPSPPGSRARSKPACAAPTASIAGFLFRGVPLRNQAGDIVQWYGTNTDIEDRKRAEEALVESERSLRAHHRHHSRTRLERPSQWNARVRQSAHRRLPRRLHQRSRRAWMDRLPPSRRCRSHAAHLDPFGRHRNLARGRIQNALR